MEKGMFGNFIYKVVDRILIKLDIKIKAHEELKLKQQILDNKLKNKRNKV